MVAAPLPFHSRAAGQARSCSIPLPALGQAAAVAAGDKTAAAAELKVASTEIAKACSKGVYHKNNAARKVSRLSKAVNGMA
jgi:hypothetical protein